MSAAITFVGLGLVGYASYAAANIIKGFKKIWKNK